MFYIESPHGMGPSIPTGKRKLFLAGGITGCPDWQMELRELLMNLDIVVINPRSKSFDTSNPEAARIQIEWEHEMLARSDAVSFWFPSETLCPITLFELGAMSYRKIGDKPMPIFVGAHADYARRFDIETQLGLQRPDVKIADDLFGLALQIQDWSRG